MRRTLLIDADIVAYSFAASAQKKFDFKDGTEPTIEVEPLEDVVPLVAARLQNWMERLKADDLVVCLSCPTADGWRIKLLPTYKAGRGEKPVLLNPIKQWMRENYETFERPTLEADDVMGILSTHPTLIKGQKIIVSIDKDMMTIPGWLWNPDKDPKAWKVSPEEADYRHLYQTIVGDSTDNYKGCPGAGPIAAEYLLTNCEGWEQYTHHVKSGPRKGTPEIRWKPWAAPTLWDAVVSLYAKAGCSPEDALLQARMARICRHTDYDYKTKEVKLWCP